MFSVPSSTSSIVPWMAFSKILVKGVGGSELAQLPDKLSFCAAGGDDSDPEGA